MLGSSFCNSCGKIVAPRCAAFIGIIVALAGAWAGYLRSSGNFHAVEAGVIYRSGQLSGQQFANHIREQGIRTIINLRGNHVGQAWYDEEMKASTAADVQHIDYPISAGTELSDEHVIQLVKLLRESRRPILIHCEGGADRSGLVSALYKLLVAKSSPDEASAQLSFRYGHFPWLGNSTAAMDRTFARFASTMQSTKGAWHVISVR